MCESHSVLSASFQPHGLCIPWDSPGQNTRVGSCSLLQGIFPTQGSNQGLPNCGQILYQLSPQGSPRIMEWLAYPFSRGNSQPRNWTWVSCITGTFFTSWATREAHLLPYIWAKSSNTKPLIIKCSISYVIYWELYRKWKTEWLNGYRMIGSVSVSGVCFVITQLTGSGSSLLLPSIMREYPTTYRWPGETSKFKSL